MALSLEERVRVRHHLGYPQLGTIPMLSLGVPSAGQPAWLLEMAMDRLLPEAEPLARRVLGQCDSIEKQMCEARGRLPVVRVIGSIDLNQNELEKLTDEYVRWTDKLADVFTAMKQPFSLYHQKLDGVVFVDDGC